jgi:hypothetical protein
MTRKNSANFQAGLQRSNAHSWYGLWAYFWVVLSSSWIHCWDKSASKMLCMLFNWNPCNFISRKIGLLFFEKENPEMSLLLWFLFRYILKRDVIAHGSLHLSSLLPWPKAVQLLLYGVMARKKNNPQERGGKWRNCCVHIRVVANFTPPIKYLV